MSARPKLEPITNDNAWIFSYNIEYYDLHAAIHELPSIDWGTDDSLSRNKVKENDVIYLYSSRPEQTIYYRCRVITANKTETTVDDTVYGGHPAGTEMNCVELEVECEYTGDGITYKELLSHGLKRGALTKRRIKDPELIAFLHEYESNPDNIVEPYYYQPGIRSADNISSLLNPAMLYRHIVRFEEFIRAQDNNEHGFISFSEKGTFLEREEHYKYDIAKAARNALSCDEWSRSWIGTGKIAKQVLAAMGHADNLVYSFGQIDFRNRLNPEKDEFKPEAERILYDIFCEGDDQFAFESAIDVFGAKYATIAYLFFIKDPTQYLPISPENFDDAFTRMGCDFRMSHQCSWKNYQTFIQILREIQGALSKSLKTDLPVSLLDAHSFVWIIQEEKYIQWGENVDEVVETITAIDKEINALPLQGLEKEAVRKERINQGKFRELLLRTQKECIVCGLHNKSLLTASHIKPWSVSSPDERLDSNNGLMMCPSHDKLFDRNLISFTENGDIMISKTLSDDDCIKLNVNPNMHISISEGAKKYLDYHRKKFQDSESSS